MSAIVCVPGTPIALQGRVVDRQKGGHCMNLKIYRLTAVLTLLLLPGLAVGGGKKRTDGVNDGAEIAGSNAVLRIDPGNIASRDLYYGPGGKEHQPHGPFTFEKE